MHITCPPNQKTDKPSTAFPIAVTFRFLLSHHSYAGNCLKDKSLQSIQGARERHCFLISISLSNKKTAAETLSIIYAAAISSSAPYSPDSNTSLPGPNSIFNYSLNWAQFFPCSFEFFFFFLFDLNCWNSSDL